MNLRKSLANLSLMTIFVFAAIEAPASEENGFILIGDEDGNPLYMADAAGQEVTFVYDEDGQVVATVDQDGVVTDWQQLFYEAGVGEQ